VRAQRQSVLVRRYSHGLHITNPETGTSEQIPFTQLRKGQRIGQNVLIEHSERPGWRLRFAAASAVPWFAHIAQKDSLRAWIKRVGYAQVGAGASLIGVLGFYVAVHFIDWTVALLPQSWMEQLGDSVVAQAAGDAQICTGAGGQAALDALAKRLFPDQLGRDKPLRVQVIDHPTVNAFATPGGRVVLFAGLIKNAPSSDAIAGVLAHEFGHVKHKHPERSLVRSASLSLLVGAFLGDFGQSADLFLTLANSRDYERQADMEALAALARIGASPEGFADFFENLAKEESDSLSTGSDFFDSVLGNVGPYLSTHPELKERAMAARRLINKEARYSEALDAKAWAEVQAMCKSDEQSEQDEAADTPDANP
jgi:predicted Zn-dependent protease